MHPGMSKVKLLCLSISHHFAIVRSVNSESAHERPHITLTCDE